jgi:SAM-dependent methyltransferase
MGTLVADVGCGNGKYMAIDPHCFFIGTDRSVALLQICAERAFEVFVADALKIPFRDNAFDLGMYFVCIYTLM